MSVPADPEVAVTLDYAPFTVNIYDGALFTISYRDQVLNKGGKPERFVQLVNVDPTVLQIVLSDFDLERYPPTRIRTSIIISSSPLNSTIVAKEEYGKTVTSSILLAINENDKTRPVIQSDVEYRLLGLGFEFKLDTDALEQIDEFVRMKWKAEEDSSDPSEGTARCVCQ